MERENMTQEQIEATFEPTTNICPDCGKYLYFDNIKETMVCLECNYEK